MSIAWAALEDIARAQLLTFHPELQFEHDLAIGKLPRCPRPECDGPVIRDDGEIKCLLCGRRFDEHGDEIKPVVNSGRVIQGGSRHDKM